MRERRIAVRVKETSRVHPFGISYKDRKKPMIALNEKGNEDISDSIRRDMYGNLPDQLMTTEHP